VIISGIFPRVLKKTAKTLSQDSWYPAEIQTELHPSPPNPIAVGGCKNISITVPKDEQGMHMHFFLTQFNQVCWFTLSLNKLASLDCHVYSFVDSSL
jgi:hypothetical protein